MSRRTREPTQRACLLRELQLTLPENLPDSMVTLDGVTVLELLEQPARATLASSEARQKRADDAVATAVARLIQACKLPAPRRLVEAVKAEQHTVKDGKTVRASLRRIAGRLPDEHREYWSRKPRPRK